MANQIDVEKRYKIAELDGNIVWLQIHTHFKESNMFCILFKSEKKYFIKNNEDNFEPIGEYFGLKKYIYSCGIEEENRTNQWIHFKSFDKIFKILKIIGKCKICENLEEIRKKIIIERL